MEWISFIDDHYVAADHHADAHGSDQTAVEAMKVGDTIILKPVQLTIWR